jgi:hypothetical protein
MLVPLENPCRVSRRKLRELFREGVSVEYGKELVGIEEKRRGGGEGGRGVQGWDERGRGCAGCVRWGAQCGAEGVLSGTSTRS